MCAHRLPSVPAWTALRECLTPHILKDFAINQIASTAPRAQTEESEASASSQDMHDELDEPGPSSPARPQLGSKRKDEGKRRQSTGKHKKRRISERINVFNDEGAFCAVFFASGLGLAALISYRRYSCICSRSACEETGEHAAFQTSPACVQGAQRCGCETYIRRYPRPDAFVICIST